MDSPRCLVCKVAFDRSPRSLRTRWLPVVRFASRDQNSVNQYELLPPDRFAMTRCQKEEDCTNVCLYCLYACSGHADRDVPGFLPRRVLKDLKDIHLRRRSARQRRSQRKTQAEPDNVPKASEVLGRMPTCPQGPGQKLYTNDAASRSTVTIGAIGAGPRKRNSSANANGESTDKLEWAVEKEQTANGIDTSAPGEGSQRR